MKSLVQKQSKIQSQKGYTLWEFAMTMALILLLTMAVFQVWQSVSASRKVTSSFSDIQTILKASLDWKAGKTSYSGISMSQLDNLGLLPTSLGNGNQANPWGGNYSVAASSSNMSKVDITLTNIPSKMALQLQDKLSSITEDSSDVSVSGSTVRVSL
jgi:type II secretory pathway pseudopilin PulG